MAKRAFDINQKIAYLTHRKSTKAGAAPLLKTKDPIQLKNEYLPKRKRETADQICHDEMMDMLDCLKRNNGYNEKCSSQISKLLKCESSYKLNQERRLKEAKLSGKTVDGDVEQSIANKLLKKNPTLANQQAWRVKRNLLVRLDSAKIQPYPFEEGGRPYRKPI